MKKKLGLDIVYQSLYQILMVISPLITSPFIARTLGNEKYGVYSYYYSIAYYFGIFILLGLSNYGSRVIAQNRAEGQERINRIFSELVILQMIMLLFVLLVYFVASFFINNYKTIYFIEVFYILSVGFDISWLFFGLEEFKLTTVRSFFVKLINVFLILVFIRRPNDLSKYTIIMAGSALCGSLLLWKNISNYVSFEKVRIKSVLRHFKPNIVLFIPVVSLAVFHYTDKIMLGSLSSMSEVGFYSNADKIVNIPLGLINGLGVVMLPKITNLLASGNNKKAILYLNNSIVLSIWGSTALCFGIMSILEDFIPLFFGKGYSRCIELLYDLAVVVIIKSISNVLKTQFLIPNSKDVQFNISVIIAAVINVFFNTILIPRWGAVGAVYGTIIAETIVLIMYIIYSFSVIDWKYIIPKFIYSLVSGLIMYLFILFVKNRMCFESRIICVFTEVISGAMIYIVISIPIWNRFILKSR